MIREALAKQIPLLNSKLTVIRTHNLIFDGDDVKGSIFEKGNLVERDAGRRTRRPRSAARRRSGL
jgi:hypothetical protein